jgi:hypothetical protein
MFKENKYYKWYFDIISNASKNSIERNDGYFEKHHIIPKSLGGNNSKENIVKLTAREHFICHLLLPKMLEGKQKQSMCFALNMMASKSKYHKRTSVSSRTYEKIKEMVRPLFSEINLGRKCSDETKSKMSESRKITHNTPEFKKAASIRQSNRTPEHRAKMGAAHKGKTISVEMRQAISEKVSGENNPRALTWIIEFENKSQSIIVKSLKTWCKENNISFGMIYRTVSTERFYKGVIARRL